MKISAILRLLFLAQIAFVLYVKADIGYVTLSNADAIAVIDTTTQTLVTTFAAGDTPQGVALSRNQRYLYVTNFNANTVTVYDTAVNNALVATIPVGANPLRIAISPDGSLAYALNFSGSSVSVINTATNTVTATIPIGVGLQPNSVVFHPNGLYAYVQAGIFPNDLYLVDVASNTATPSGVSFGTLQTQSLGILPNGSRLYVGLGGVANNLRVVDLTIPTAPVLDPTPLNTGGSQVPGIGISPDGLRAYGSNFLDATAWILDTTTNTFPVAPVAVGNLPYGAAVTSDNGFAAISNLSDGTVSLINAVSFAVVATINVGGGSEPIYIAFKKIISPVPEATLTGKHKKEDFGVVYQYYNELKWTLSSSSGIAGYHIYRDGLLIGTVGPSTHKFRDNNRPKGVTFTYAITAFDSNGVESAPSYVVVPG